MNSLADPSIPPSPKVPLSVDNPNAEGAPAASPGSTPPVITDSPPKPAGKSSSFRQITAVLLSLCLGLFLACGAVSLLDDSLVLLWGLHFLTLASAILTSITLLLIALVYGLMGFTPLIPKRVFLPVILLIGLGLLAVFPTLIYCHHRILQLDWLLSLLQVALVLGICYRLRGRGRFRWSVVEVRHLGSQPFSWWNLSVFLLLNVFVLLPALVAYLALCTSLAVSHFTDGFLALRPSGLILQARKYVREDGKTVVLFPMSHIADTNFYRAVSQSVPSNAIVLLEGVTDNNNLLTNKLSYKQAARSLGLAEQRRNLKIRHGRLVRADVDVQEFSSNTIAILNLVALVHTRGLNSSTVSQLMAYSPSPDVQKKLFTDLLRKRNEHLLKEFYARLPESDNFIIPWGAAHMPEIAKEIQKSGFHLVETREYVSIRFGSRRNKSSSPGNAQDSENSK